ncbi:hypothetical protein QJS83_00615 [Bdellovibrio sp. 22V]|uniref:hypothetical protein n=1 Tax=Bdellovibrio TaxID=958 RepID=UPI0025428F00|nr:hypothetical protein [Bdellovibrio sp. 22V]WII72367.1 hypothetical protein QJS83_00615 [Bdellovibrio sp. 22V]
MKQADITKVLAQDYKTTNVDELNKLLKDKNTEQVKYKISGKTLGHLGFTGFIKTVAAEGLKVFAVNKVSLLRFEDIEKFEKAKPKSERPLKVKKDAEEKSMDKAAEPFNKRDTVFAVNDDGYDDLRPKKYKKKAVKPSGKAGSKFIPKK